MILLVVTKLCNNDSYPSKMYEERAPIQLKLRPDPYGRRNSIQFRLVPGSHPQSRLTITAKRFCTSADFHDLFITLVRQSVPLKMTKFQQMESDGEQIRRFVFGSKSRNDHQSITEKLEILIPELPLPGYSFYTWPSAPVLAWFLWDRRQSLINKRILEIGAGTALPGILAAKCGAHVTLSDCSTLPKTLEHIHRCCRLNNLTPGPGNSIEIIGLTWGLFLDQVLQIGPIDLILGSDVFYDPSVFEDILVTISFILEANPSAKFICTYQERSADWCIQNLLKKWDLVCSVISLDNLSEDIGIDPQELMGNHTIHLLEVVRQPIA